MTKIQGGIAENRAWAPTGEEKEIDCDLCGSKKKELIAEENNYRVVRCTECSLIYVSPQPSEHDLQKFYDQYFPSESDETWDGMMRKNFDHGAEFIRDEMPHPGTILDIGCGHGFFLKRFADDGWDARGIDFSPDAVSAANKMGNLSVQQGEFGPGLFEENYFDAVTAWYVLEHVREPVVFAEEAYRILKSGGIFGIRVPNMVFSNVFLALKKVPKMEQLLYKLNIDTDGKSSHFNIIDPPAHLHGFTPKTIKKLLTQVGFSDVSVIPSQPVEVGSAGTVMAKKILFGTTAMISKLSGHSFNPAPAVTAFARKP
jgi:2-polyprenyl-3-methyl-5-hydroxy-6-metoxy-1,4-benzoquinol methylase